jgi:hypothetical protein
MVNKSKAKGTAGETGIVKALIEAGWVHAERRALAGAEDRGDINIGGFPVMIEAKNCSAITIGAWLKEVAAEKANAKAEVGACWFKLRGKGDARDWAVVMSGAEFMEILKRLGYHPEAGR